VELVDTQVSEFKTAMFPVVSALVWNAFSEEKPAFRRFLLFQEAAQLF
jgi:hypothetical protein